MNFKSIASEWPATRAIVKAMLLRLVFAAFIVGTPAVARDNGQFSNVSPAVRTWFHGVKSPSGIPCCDIADGHRTDYDMRKNRYWVPINGTWMPVPPQAVINNSGNPVGDAIVWYSTYANQVVIRCFVPGAGT